MLWSAVRKLSLGTPSLLTSGGFFEDPAQRGDAKAMEPGPGRHTAWCLQPRNRAMKVGKRCIVRSPAAPQGGLYSAALAAGTGKRGTPPPRSVGTVSGSRA